MESSVSLLLLSFLIVGISSQPANQQCTPPNQKNPKDCCSCPSIVPSRDVFATCMQKFPMPAMPPTPGTMPPFANCIAECILEQLGIMSNGAVSKDAAKTKITALLGSTPDWQAMSQSTVDTCVSQTSALGGQKDSNGCSVVAGAFFECLPTTMFINCPKSSWTSSAECDQLKDYLKKGCSIMTLKAGPPPM